MSNGEAQACLRLISAHIAASASKRACPLAHKCDIRSDDLTGGEHTALGKCWKEYCRNPAGELLAPYKRGHQLIDLFLVGTLAPGIGAWTSSVAEPQYDLVGSRRIVD